MTSDMLVQLILVYLGLFAWCRFYAAVLSLEAVREWYIPDWTWLMVVGGFVWVGLAMWAIEAWVMPLTVMHYAGCCVTAGAPIIMWQLEQHRMRDERARLRARQGRTP